MPSSHSSPAYLCDTIAISQAPTNRQRKKDENMRAHKSDITFQKKETDLRAYSLLTELR